MKVIPYDYLYKKRNVFPFLYREVFLFILANAPTIEIEPTGSDCNTSDPNHPDDIDEQ